MKHFTILPGHDKDQRPEHFEPICLEPGSLCAIAGNTGSGKSRLIKDIEQLAAGDSVLDLTVRDFLTLHCRCRDRKTLSPQTIIDTANTITPEPVRLEESLNLLSGGQSRALMIADIALACDSPIVLIDEIENAGIDKKKALHLLTGTRKLVLIVTHDPHTALMAPKRIIMQNGAIRAVLTRTAGEDRIFSYLDRIYEEQTALQARLRKGEFLS